MKQFKFGRYRKIDLFETAAEKAEINIEFLFRMPFFAEFNSGDVDVIGQIDSDLPVITIKNKAGAFSFITAGSSLALVQVADSVERLEALLALISAVWQKSPGKDVLIKNEEIMKLYHETLQQLKRDNPGSDISFWDDYAFLDLKLGLT
jgi:hypothetical protein